ncbi:TaqI-like C-terminal specificity domain-containing protein, partial [Phocaeicola plebeius]|uniref:TaqI-like C-terminal specificity domain-containing protein n=1 Tax=Phocaeicola plebeius TaxID=310297 RepID=UPI00286EB956
SDFVQQQGVKCNFADSIPWVILSPIEQSIRRKIESIGTPLKDWDINIYRGVLTGYNDAFIISTEKRDEILANCQTEGERVRTAELIRPILRGRDIRRYGYKWAELWIINIHNGIKGKLPRIKIEDYPAIKAHLDLYWDKISKRTDKGDTPYNLRNCAYMEDFSKPKIIWGEISDKSKFAFDFLGEYIPEATSFYMKGECIEYLLSALNSSVSEWLFSKVGTTTGVGTIRWKKYTIEQLIVAKLSTEQLNTHLAAFNDLKVGKMSITDFECFSNKLMYDVYKLTSDEIQYIENQQIV